MTKYYAIWDKEQNKWWGDGFPNCQMVDGVNINKKVNNIPIWDYISFSFSSDSSFEFREFTPIDALLVKCGKI